MIFKIPTTQNCAKQKESEIVVAQKWKEGGRKFAYEQWSICIDCQQNMVSVKLVTMAEETQYLRKKILTPKLILPAHSPYKITNL